MRAITTFLILLAVLALVLMLIQQGDRLPESGPGQQPFDSAPVPSPF